MIINKNNSLDILHLCMYCKKQKSLYNKKTTQIGWFSFACISGIKRIPPTLRDQRA